MSTAVQPAGGGGGSTSSGLADVLDTILDKGLVIDVYVSVSLVGIELLRIDARVVVASIDTYLKFAERVNRLDLTEQKEGLPGLMQDINQGGAEHKVKGGTKGALEAAGDKLRDVVGEADGKVREPASRRRGDESEER
ncbi:MAG: gas vesicle structural protein GvpA [Acidimicrobiaceae bacterium]|nr:gas vesicle structural protein GvpA [Acidimicrobiaceae bacterium]